MKTWTIVYIFGSKKSNFSIFINSIQFIGIHVIRNRPSYNVYNKIRAFVLRKIRVIVRPELIDEFRKFKSKIWRLQYIKFSAIYKESTYLSRRLFLFLIISFSARHSIMAHQNVLYVCKWGFWMLRNNKCCVLHNTPGKICLDVCSFFTQSHPIFYSFLILKLSFEFCRI